MYFPCIANHYGTKEERAVGENKVFEPTNAAVRQRLVVISTSPGTGNPGLVYSSLIVKDDKETGTFVRSEVSLMWSARK